MFRRKYDRECDVYSEVFINNYIIFKDICIFGYIRIEIFI